MLYRKAPTRVPAAGTEEDRCNGEGNDKLFREIRLLFRELLSLRRLPDQFQFIDAYPVCVV